MHCNGKCHLMKKMKEEEKNENLPFSNLKDKYESLTQPEVSSFSFSCSSIFIAHNSVYRIHHSTSHLLPVFQPPSC
jgi:hypothetical protein